MFLQEINDLHGMNYDISFYPIVVDPKIQFLCFKNSDIHSQEKYYWNTCENMYLIKPLDKFYDFNSIVFLDYKITCDMFNDNESFNCLEQYFTSNKNKKILHIVNTYESLFDLKEWCELIKILDDFEKYIYSNLILEIVNYVYFDKKNIEKEFDFNFHFNSASKLDCCNRSDLYVFEKRNIVHYANVMQNGLTVEKNLKTFEFDDQYGID